MKTCCPAFIRPRETRRKALPSGAMPLSALWGTLWFAKSAIGTRPADPSAREVMHATAQRTSSLVGGLPWSPSSTHRSARSSSSDKSGESAIPFRRCAESVLNCAFSASATS
eukprot:scaffold262490_cov30-Tisochrysis_lutea.AAC.2